MLLVCLVGTAPGAEPTASERIRAISNLVGFTYDGTWIKAYYNGVFEAQPGHPENPALDRRDHDYYTKTGPGGGYRGMNPYYQPNGIYTFDPNDPVKQDEGAPFTVGARQAVGNAAHGTLKGWIGGLAVFDRALSEAEMRAIHNAALPAEPWIDNDPLVAQTLLISVAERERLIQLESAGLQTVRPVALPRGAYLKGNNTMLGWPVAARIGNTLLCVYHQWLTHTGSPRKDADSSEAVVLRSTDNGQTWSDPIDIKQFGVNRGTMVLGFGNCLGVLSNKVFLATDYGFYRSEDEGATWQLVPDVLTQAQTGVTVRDNFGPRMIIHPTRGLVICVAPELSQPYMDVYSSQDEGATWQRERVTLSNTYNPVEPTGFYHDGRLIFLSRNHTIPLGATTHPSLMVSETGWFPFTRQGISNISSFGWPDTTDIDFNPVTQRYEAVVTNRRGGVGDNERNEQHEQTVNLWSLSKADLQAGHADQWRYEGTLLRLKSGWLDQSAEDIDAAHPGGAVMDVAQGVQHIFIYCGTFGTPTAIYRITRTLDTAKLLGFYDTNAASYTEFGVIGAADDRAAVVDDIRVWKQMPRIGTVCWGR